MGEDQHCQTKVASVFFCLLRDKSLKISLTNLRSQTIEHYCSLVVSEVAWDSIETVTDS